MLVHTVMFYLKPELTPERREEFRQSLAALGAIKSMTAFYLGTPAPVPPRAASAPGFPAETPGSRDPADG
jgi:hypothetical protein